MPQNKLDPRIQSFIDAISPTLSDIQKEVIREALVFAVTSSVTGKEKWTTARLIVSEFYHSLNRKRVLSNDEVAPEVDAVYKQLHNFFGCRHEKI